MKGHIYSDAKGVLSLFLHGKTVTVDEDDSRFDEMMAACEQGDYDLAYDIYRRPVKQLEESVSIAANHVKVEHGMVTYNGKSIHNVLTKKIVQMQEQGVNFTPFVLFLENLMENPSKRSVDQLYKFLDNEVLPITPDGHFIAYKGVTQDLKDHHTRTVDNSPGKVISMPRNEVDDNPNNHCSQGYHFGSYNYAKSFGHTLLAVKVNPRDVVSIPSDHDCQKARCCRYEVLSILKEKEYIEDAVYVHGEEKTETTPIRVFWDKQSTYFFLWCEGVTEYDLHCQQGWTDDGNVSSKGYIVRSLEEGVFVEVDPNHIDTFQTRNSKGHFVNAKDQKEKVKELLLDN